MNKQMGADCTSPRPTHVGPEASIDDLNNWAIIFWFFTLVSVVFLISDFRFFLSISYDV